MMADSHTHLSSTEKWAKFSTLVTKINLVSNTLAGKDFFEAPPLEPPSFSHPELSFQQVISRLYRLFKESGRKCLKVFEQVLCGRISDTALDYLESGLDVVRAFRHLEQHQPGSNYVEFVRDTQHWLLTVVGSVKPQSGEDFAKCTATLLSEAMGFLQELESFLSAAARDPISADLRREEILRAHEGVDPSVFAVTFNKVWRRLGLPFSQSVRNQLMAEWRKYSWEELAVADLPTFTERWLLTRSITRFPLPMDDNAILRHLGLPEEYRHWVTLFGLCVYRQALMSHKEFGEHLDHLFGQLRPPHDVNEREVLRLIELFSLHPDPEILVKQWIDAAGAVNTPA